MIRVFKGTNIRWKLVLFTLLGLVAVFAFTAFQVTRADEPGVYVVPQNAPERGLVYDGLQVGASGSCVGLFQLSKSGLCTPGPDPAPPGVNLSQSAPPVSPNSLSAAAVVCQGDGVTGNRIQVIYARPSNRANRFWTYLSSFRTWASGADNIFNLSALETGGTRHLRFVTTAGTGCLISVANVVLTTSGDDNFDNTISQLRAKGFNKANRKYLIFMDATVYCGIGSLWLDDRATQQNLNNTGPSYARVDAGCWGFNGATVAAHEVMHTLGAVQRSAPHATLYFHCTDDYDRMCYNDGGGALRVLCGLASHDRRFDCNHDDYYSTNPLPLSYLATKWNAARNRFLIGGGP